MGMKKERLKVLDMVEKGTITVEEASRLLENLAVTGEASREHELVEDFEESASNFAHSVEVFLKDMGGKVGEKYKDMEPKIRVATKKVVEKTAVLMDDLSKSLHESAKNMESKLEEFTDKVEDAIVGENDDTPREN